MAGPKTCVFCGLARRLTDEHIFAAWVDAIFPEAAKEKARFTIARIGAPPRVYEGLPFEQRVPVVCGSCNSGWMNRLETAVGPVLGPIVRGDAASTEIAPPMQRTIATWATKTAFMLEHLHPANRVVPDVEYRRLYAAEQPPPYYMVFLARRASIINPDTGAANLVMSREQEINAIAYTQDVTDEEIRSSIGGGATAYRITVALGFLVFVVLGHSFPNPLNLTVTPNGEHLIRCVWPLQGRLGWPTAWPIEQVGGFEALHNAFDPATHPLRKGRPE